MPEPALPEVSGPGARPLARRTTRRTAPGALCSCRLHAASSTGVAGSAEQRGDLRTVVPCQCPDTDRCRVRSPVPRSRDWILQRAPHLEPETAAEPSLIMPVIIILLILNEQLRLIFHTSPSQYEL